jgi:hypothetical protein
MSGLDRNPIAPADWTGSGPSIVVARHNIARGIALVFTKKRDGRSDSPGTFLHQTSSAIPPNKRFKPVFLRCELAIAVCDLAWPARHPRCWRLVSSRAFCPEHRARIVLMGFGQNSSDSSSFPSVWSRRTRLPPQIIRTVSSVCFKLSFP